MPRRPPTRHHKEPHTLSIQHPRVHHQREEQECEGDEDGADVGAEEESGGFDACVDVVFEVLAGVDRVVDYCPAVGVGELGGIFHLCERERRVGYGGVGEDVPDGTEEEGTDGACF